MFRYDSRTGNGCDLKVQTKSLIIAKDDNKKLLAGFNLSTDGGWTWKSIASSAKALFPNYGTKYFRTNFDMVVNEANDAIYFNASDVVLLIRSVCLEDDQPNDIKNYLISSSDMGNSWELLRKQKGTEFLYSNPFDSSDLFLGYRERVKDKGKNKEYDVVRISRSLDRGRTWNPFCLYASKGDEIRVSMTIAKEGNKRAIYVGTLDGLYKTLDDGLTWELLGGIKTDDKRGKTFRISSSPPPPALFSLDQEEIMTKVLSKEEVYLTWEELFDKNLIKAHKTYRGLIAPGPFYIEDRDRDKGYLFNVRCKVTISEHGEVTFNEIDSVKDDKRGFMKISGIRDRVYDLVKQTVIKWQFNPFTRNDEKVKVTGIVSIPVRFRH